MREQQEDIEAKRFLNEEDLNNSNLASRMRQRNDVRDKNKRHARKHKKKKLKTLQNVCARTHSNLKINKIQ